MLTKPFSLAGFVLVASLLTGCGGNESESAPHHATSPSPTATSAPSAGITTLLNTGIAQLHQGDTAAAKNTFGNVLALDPRNVPARYNLGLIAQQAGQDAQAMKEYDAALAMNEAYAPALYNRAILTEPVDLPGAVDLYKRAVAADPTFAQAFMRLGFALVHLGSKTEGAADLGKGLSLDPAMAAVEAPRY